MSNKQQTSKLTLRIATATLALSLMQLSAGTTFMTTVAMASSGGGGGGGGGGAGDRGEGSGISTRSNFSGGNTAKARCKSSAYKRKDAAAFCSKKLGKAVVCRGKPRRWICS